MDRREFALKKIRVHNSEGVKGAMREVEAYRRFKSVMLRMLLHIY